MNEKEFITGIWRGLLNRDPDDQETRSLLDELARGVPPAELVRTLRDCAEFQSNRYGDREFVPGGHFYSAVPSIADRKAYLQHSNEYFGRTSLPGIVLDEDYHQAHLRAMVRCAREWNFPEHKSSATRYHSVNPAYGYGDGLSLFTMLKTQTPHRIVEVGSGYSSALMLDTTERTAHPATRITFVEPFPTLLKSLLRGDDADRCRIVEQPVQTVPLEIFTELERGDILFIDSTHVAKLGSDVNFLFLEVLPQLKPGVVVHVHDIFWPFDYPAPWIEDGRAWTEAYLLRAILLNTARYAIRYMSNFAQWKYRTWFDQHLPQVVAAPGGHLWFEVRG